MSCPPTLTTRDPSSRGSICLVAHTALHGTTQGSGLLPRFQILVSLLLSIVAPGSQLPPLPWTAPLSPGSSSGAHTSRKSSVPSLPPYSRPSLPTAGVISCLLSPLGSHSLCLSFCHSSDPPRLCPHMPVEISAEETKVTGRGKGSLVQMAWPCPPV